MLNSLTWDIWFSSVNCNFLMLWLPDLLLQKLLPLPSLFGAVPQSYLSSCVPGLSPQKVCQTKYQFSSVTQSCLTLCDPHGWQHTRLPCPSSAPGACSNSCQLSRWCQPSHPLSSQLLDCAFFQSKTIIMSGSRWQSGKECTCQYRRCKRHEVDPWIRKTPLE